MKTVPFALLIVLIIEGFQSPVPAASLDQWVWRNPTPQGLSLFDVAYGNGVFVAVGESGTILTSLDKGTNWTVRVAGTDGRLTLNAVTFANGQFIAVGVEGNFSNPAIRTSSDGISWASLIVPTNFVTLNSIAYGNGVYVASSGTRLMVSSNAVDWTVNANATGNDITFGDGMFVLVGMETFYTGKILTSTNGVDWDLRRNDIGAQLTGVTFGDGTFVAVGTGHTVVSTNGVTWTDNIVNMQPVEVTYGDGVFVATGANLRTSLNGSSWLLRDFFTAGYGEGAAFGDGVFVSVGRNGELWDSVGGTNWTRRTTSIPVVYGAPSPLEDIAYGNGTYVAVGRTLDAGSAAGAYVSTNAVNWSHRLPGAHLRAIVHGNDLFVAVGKENDNFGNMKAFTSTDGQIFAMHDLGVIGILQDVLFADGQFLAVGDSGRIFTSPDGTNWMSQTSGTSIALTSVASLNGTYVATVQFSANVLVSTNSVNWDQVSVGTGAFMSSLAAGNGVFVGVGGSEVFTSTNGLFWDRGAAADGEILRQVKFQNGQFIGLSGSISLTSGAGNSIQTSADGVIWTKHDAGVAISLNSIVYDGDTYVVVGDDPAGRGPAIRQSVTSEVPIITLENPRFLPSGDFAFDIVASTATQVQIHATSDFQSWDLLDTIPIGASPMEFSDSSITNFANRYYQGRAAD